MRVGNSAKKERGEKWIAVESMVEHNCKERRDPEDAMGTVGTPAPIHQQLSSACSHTQVEASEFLCQSIVLCGVSGPKICTGKRHRQNELVPYVPLVLVYVVFTESRHTTEHCKGTAAIRLPFRQMQPLPMSVCDSQSAAGLKVWPAIVEIVAFVGTLVVSSLYVVESAFFFLLHF